MRGAPLGTQACHGHPARLRGARPIADRTRDSGKATDSAAYLQMCPSGLAFDGRDLIVRVAAQDGLMEVHCFLARCKAVHRLLRMRVSRLNLHDEPSRHSSLPCAGIAQQVDDASVLARRVPTR